MSTQRHALGLPVFALMLISLVADGRLAAAQAADDAPAAVGASSIREGFLPEPHIIARTLDFGTRLTGRGGVGERRKNGFFPETSNLITGSGWIAIGPGYRQWLANDAVLLEGSAAVSWRAYKVAQARIELPRLARSRVAVGSQVLWHDLTQVTYFGTGAGSLATDRSEYRLRSTNIVGYGDFRPRRWLAVGGHVGWLGGLDLLPPSGPFERGNPDARVTFADDPVYAIAQQPSYLHGGASLTADTRDNRGYPSSGGLYRAAWTRYSDRSAVGFGLHRYDVEGAHFLPFADDRVVVALHGWLATSAGNAFNVPFYLAPSLGGHNSLRGYTDYRFHDRNLLLTTAELRLALLARLDLAGFVDAGNVAARVGDLNLAKRDYGFGLRMHSRTATVARLDLAHGADGWRLVFRTSDPLQLSRLRRRTAAAPFVQ